MKLQNLAIIFIVIFIPLLLVLSYYLDQQRDTLALQAEYDLKLSEATKEAIKAFEINTVDWSSTKQTYARNNAKATMNTFITSLANNLNISGTAREYMLDYIPAIALTMYDGYYVYAPAYTPVTIENENGVQLFLNDNKITTNTEGTIIYKPERGETIGKYEYVDSKGNTKTYDITYTTDISNAKKEYKHTLNNKTAYSEEYTKGNKTFFVNYTLDNKVSIYVIDKTGSTAPITKTGYLVYFNEVADKTILPRITVNGDTISPANTTLIVSNTQYSKSDTETTKIEPETLTEQILYKNSETGAPQLGTFKYVYTTTSEKLYYDESRSQFFTLDNNVIKYVSNDTSIKVGDEGCKYKSLSILIGEGKTTEFKKIYQVLNGRDKGKWYIDLKDEDGVLDTEIKNLSELGIDTTIYKDYSAINYYVEAYAFTNWVSNSNNLGGKIKQKQLKYGLNDLNEVYSETELVEHNGLFNISASNNPEDETSMFVEHKKQVMKDSINTNLNAAISSYNRNGNYDFKLPILTDGDWEQIFSNISLITFFQGVPIGLKYYNNYAIATSTTNREYVDPNEIYFTGTNDDKYHQVYCEHCLNETYTGYRSTEFTLREYTYEETKYKYYYQHDNYGGSDGSSEIGCYYCIINKANYKQISSEKADYETIAYKQTKSYNEALARERYYQNEKVTAKVGINLIYDSNLKANAAEGGFITNVKDVNPKEILIEPNQQVKITDQEPEVGTNNDIKFEFLGWALSPDATSAEYIANDYLNNPTQILETLGKEEITLYAVWRLNLEKLDWYTYCYHPEVDKTEHSNFNHDSISKIDIVGNNVFMVGNNTNPGKGAVLLNWEYLNVDILEISFDYTIAFGDSFNTAGILLNVNDTNPGENEGTLKGYMLSFNNSRNQPWSTKSNNGENATLWMLDNYKKEEYAVNLNEANNLTWKAGLKIPLQGRIIIRVTDSGYKITEEESKTEIEVDIEGMNVNKNSIGFFSDHYSHSCSSIGEFNITNINLIAKQK